MIDEGAQMREPEAVAPLCMADSTTHIVIAGDPHQVGPSIEVLGEEASNNGLALSLLERLYTKYSDCAIRGLNPPLVTMVTNFRCHPDILSLVGNLFYTSTILLKLPDDCRSLPYRRDSACLVFICSGIDDTVQEVQQTTNPLEATIILDELMIITDYRYWPKEFGKCDLYKVSVISQNRRQLSIIKDLALKRYHRISYTRCFPTYDIQGREFQILLLSTSETTAPDASTTNLTKSLCNPFVFNTAITRAQSLVVSVGNPFLLLKTERHMIQRYGNKGKCWSTYLQHCIQKNSFRFYRGQQLKHKDRETFFAKLNTMITANLNMTKSNQMKPTLSDLTRPPTTQYELPTGTQPIKDDTTATFTGAAQPTHTTVAVEQWPDLHMDSDHAKPKKNTILLSSMEKSSNFDCQYEDLRLLRTEKDAVTFHVKAKESGNEYALRLVKFPSKILFEDKLLRRIESLKNIKEHPNIICYSSLWVERAPSDWIHRRNWSHLKDVTPCFSSHQHQPNASAVHLWDSSEADEPPLVFITLTESMCKESLADWLLRTKQDRPMDVIINFFEQVLDALCYLHEDIQVAHGNLNPSSIYLEAENTIKIGDFGLNPTSFNASPDPFGDEKQADVYALGTTFCEFVLYFNTPMEKVEMLSKLKEGICDIKGVDKTVVEVIQYLTHPNPKERPTLIAVKQDMMKEIRATFMSTHDITAGVKVPIKQTSETDYAVFHYDLVDKIHSAFQIECPVCLEILVEPIQVECCGKNICSACIKRLRDESSTCPCCKQNDYKYFHNKGLEQSLDKLKFYCKYKSKGCKWTGEMKERKNHIAECSKQNMTCIHCNEFNSDYDDIKTNHWPVCPCYPVLCPNGCRQNLQRKAVEKHQEYTCPQTIINCEFEIVGCKEQLKRKDMSAHLKDSLLTHTFMQCQSHKHLILNVEAENQKLQMDINRLQTQLKQVLKLLGGMKPVHPDISIGYGHSFPSESGSNVDATMKGIVFSKHYVEQVINWRGATLQGEGIQLIVPENAVNSNDLVTIRLQVCSSAQFVLPDGLVLESPVFHISPTYQFQSEVTLAIEHFACIERTSDCQDIVFLSSPTKPAKKKLTCEETASFWKFQPYVKPTFSSDYTHVRVKLKHFCFACLARKKKKTEGHKHNYRVSLHMPLNFIPPHSHTIFCITLNHESYRMNLERYLKETFPSQKFHAACRVVRSTGAKVKLVVPTDLEKHYGYRIVPDMGYKILKTEVDSVSEHLSDVQDIATYPPRLVLKIIDVQGSRHIPSSRSLDCKIKVKGVAELRQYHLYLVPTGSDHGELSLITDTLEMKDLYEVSTYLKDLSPQNIYELGLNLGLKYPNLQRMNNLLHDMISAWLRQEDMVPQNPPTWQTLASALESIGQTGIALQVKSAYCPSQSNTV